MLLALYLGNSSLLVGVLHYTCIFFYLHIHFFHRYLQCKRNCLQKQILCIAEYTDTYVRANRVSIDIGFVYASHSLEKLLCERASSTASTSNAILL